jgi:hypothetical protein
MNKKMPVPCFPEYERPGGKNMLKYKTVAILFILLFAVILVVPIAGAKETFDNTYTGNTIVNLSKPIISEIQQKTGHYNDQIKMGINVKDSTLLSEELVKKYQTNLDLIINSLQTETGQKLSDADRENLKVIIIRETLEKTSWEQAKERMGVEEEDLKTVAISPIYRFKQAENLQLSAMPDSLTLVQVAADVNGGMGYDGAWLSYMVNGGNQLYRIDWNAYPGFTLYQCHFRDEDVPSSHAADAVYDAYRLAVYGTIEDTQGFFIYSNGCIEFGNDWDNRYSYGMGIGQHGYARLPYTSSTKIYVSNVWNHAMGTTDRNPNMRKIVYYR